MSKIILALPAKNAQEEVIKQVNDLRNTLMHGNWEQAAREAKQPSVEAYFKTVYASEIEHLYMFLDDLVKQIEVNTGERIR